MKSHPSERCVCDYGEICQAHGKVEVKTEILGAVPRLDRSKLSPEVRDIMAQMEESLRKFRANFKRI